MRENRYGNDRELAGDQMGRLIEEWIDSGKLSEIPEIKSRSLIARANSSHEPSVIVQKYTRLTLEETKRFLRYVLEALGVDLRGVGVELGAGVGGISNSLLSLYPDIEKIYAVEIVPDVVRLLQEKVTKHENNESRLIPVIGSFDELRLPDESVDFIIELDSLHHANDINATLREAARILKPGGIVVAFDRMNPNALTVAQRDFMLNVEYGEQLKKEYGLPLDTRLTRRLNGEHEITESEWRAAFKQAGLQLTQCVVFHRKCLRGLAYGVISQIPFPLRVKYGFYPMLVRFPAFFFRHFSLIPTQFRSLTERNGFAG
jgi:ubiquinone/menaquinone biosynthesis C-methylase UbiE